MNRISRTILAVILIGTCNATHAAFDWFDRSEEGWFFYKDPKALEKKEEPPTPPTKEEPEEAKKPEEAKEPSVVIVKVPQEKEATETKEPPQPPEGSAAWIRVHWPKIRDIAIDNPTDENIKRAAYMHQLMISKADVFQEKWILAHQADPKLDYNNERPMAGNVTAPYAQIKRQKVSDALKQISQDNALVFFFTGNDAISATMAANVHDVEVSQGFTILPVSMDGEGLQNNAYTQYRVDQGQAKLLGINSTTALYMLLTKTNEWIPIAHNYINSSEVKERIINIAYLNGIIDENIYRSTKDVETPLLRDYPRQPRPEGETDPYAEFFKKLNEGDNR